MPLVHPEPGLVISYHYLWRSEAEDGLSEGRKARPCAVILVVKRDPSGQPPSVTVAPITHTPPPSGIGVEIPPAVKRHLGLDDQPSWVIMREFNVFTWPGFDLAPIRSHVGVNQPPRFHYGHLPPALFRRLIETFVELRRRTPPDITPRDT